MTHDRPHGAHPPQSPHGRHAVHGPADAHPEALPEEFANDSSIRLGGPIEIARGTLGRPGKGDEEHYNKDGEH